MTFNTLLDNIANCIYTDVSNVNLPSTDNGITLLHINMRSINNEKNFDKFEEFLKALPFLPDIVCVSETQIKGDPLVNISLPQYNLVHDDSTTRAGGVAIYVSKKFRFETEPKFKMKIDGCEDLWLNIVDKISVKQFAVGAICRHPNADVEAIEAFSEA